MWFLDWVLFNLCQFIYPLIPNLYEGIDKLARVDLFSGSGAEIRDNVWNNLYILLSVVILFAIAIKLINAIVNPDVLGEKKKGVKSLYFRAFISVFLVILLPIAFDILKNVQDHILDNEIISKIIIGTRTEDGGQTLAKYTANAFVDFPDDSNNPLLTDKNIDVALEEMDTAEVHRYRDNGYVNKINTLLMLIAGVFIVYELIVIALDTAVRAIKLKVLELMVPIVLGGYMFKEEILKKWVIEYIKTFIQLFLLLVSIYLIAIILPLVREIVNEDAQYGWVIKTLLIFGLLTLARQIPNLINTIFGVNIKGKGGIRGRLGEMAAVGGLAQRAFDSLRQHPLQTTRRIAAAPISAIGGQTAHITAAAMRAANMMDRGNVRGGLRALAAGVLTSGGAAIRGARQGFRNGNLQGIGAQGRRYEDTHIGDSTFGGRIIDTARTTLGLRTREEEEVANANSITVRGQQMSFEELEARQKLYNQVNSSASNIRSTIESGIKTNTSNVVFDGAAAITATAGGRTVTLTGNYNSVLEQIETLKNAGPSGGMTNEDHASLISSLRHQLDLSADNARDSILAQYMRNGDLVANINGHAVNFQAGQKAQIKAEMAHITDILDNNQEMFNAMASNNKVGGVATNMGRNQTTGNLQFGDNFMAGAMNGIYDYLADINRSVNAYNDEQSARRTSQQGRERHDSSTSVRNANNNGGNNGGNNH